MKFLAKRKNKFFFVAIIFCMTGVISSCSLFPDSILIKVSDDSKCNLTRYSIEMPEMTVSFSSEQATLLTGKRRLGELFLEIPIVTDAAERRLGELFLEIPIVTDAADSIKYRLHAEYENCKEIVSQEREVKRSYIIYESIYGNKIDYAIRAK